MVLVINCHKIHDLLAFPKCNQNYICNVRNNFVNKQKNVMNSICRGYLLQPADKVNVLKSLQVIIFVILCNCF